MQTVGIKVLKDRLSEYLRMVAAGETVLVTDRGRIVAEINPPCPKANEALSPEQRWAELIRRGIVRPAVRRWQGVPPRMKKRMPFEQLMREIEADREER